MEIKTGLVSKFNNAVRVGTDPETAMPLEGKLEFDIIGEEDKKQELRDCSSDLEYIEELLEENEAERERLEERKAELEEVQKKYEEWSEIKRKISEYNRAILRLNSKNNSGGLHDLDIDTLINAASKEVINLYRKKDELEGKYKFVIKAKRVVTPQSVTEIFRKVADSSNRANAVPPLCAQGSIDNGNEFIMDEEKLANNVSKIRKLEAVLKKDKLSELIFNAAEKIRDDAMNHRTYPLSAKRDYCEKLKKSLKAVNIIQEKLDPSSFSPEFIEMVANFLQQAREDILEKLEEFDEAVNADDGTDNRDN
jgi:DNA repair exonuclease SbcCD ATPase subunit